MIVTQLANRSHPRLSPNLRKKVNSDEVRPNLTVIVQDATCAQGVHMWQGHLNYSLALYQPRGTIRDLSAKYSSYDGETISGILHETTVYISLYLYIGRILY